MIKKLGFRFWGMRGPFLKKYSTANISLTGAKVLAIFRQNIFRTTVEIERNFVALVYVGATKWLRFLANTNWDNIDAK